MFIKGQIVFHKHNLGTYFQFQFLFHGKILSEIACNNWLITYYFPSRF
jgi:hypothetical protein